MREPVKAILKGQWDDDYRLEPDEISNTKLRISGILLQPINEKF